MARIIAMADLKERMKGKEAMALEQGKKMAEIAAEVCVWNFRRRNVSELHRMYRVPDSCTG